MFTMDELSIMRLYAGEGVSRGQVLADLTDCLLFVDDDGVWHLVSSLIEKLTSVSEDDFAGLDLTETLATLP